jgi:zinc transport system permease protein
VLAQFGVTVGLWSSAALNIATGLSIVLFMALTFAAIFATQKFKSLSVSSAKD